MSKLAPAAALLTLAMLAGCDTRETPEQQLQSSGIAFANGSTDRLGIYSFDIPGSTCTGKIEQGGKLNIYDGTPRIVIASFWLPDWRNAVTDAATRHCFSKK